MQKLKFPLTADRSRVIEMITLAPDGYIVEIHKPSRTLEQNALYWSMVREAADRIKVDGKQFTPQTWHIYFKQRFLPGKIIELPNGEIMEADPSTTDLTVDEFSTFIDEVTQFMELHK